jgi:hypothetical protein
MQWQLTLSMVTCAGATPRAGARVQAPATASRAGQAQTAVSKSMPQTYHAHVLKQIMVPIVRRFVAYFQGERFCLCGVRVVC